MLTGDGEFVDKCTYAYGTDLIGNKVTYHGCLPTAEENKCESTFYVKGVKVYGCCCETSKCNDAEFTARCGGSNIIQTNLLLIAITLIIAIHVSK